ncbi:MAG: glycerol-3-phosphate 1-O-acyltransferase PlsY [Firmicutes bacterium]|mgnify:CR=1 FL=1|nr:glycerol-3-phosphate 1-O-acyltransferase PlsY [Bacillota bacterium]
MSSFLIVAAAYLLGSIPFGYLAGKLLKGIDIRQYGSGNIGTTNIHRILGLKPAIIVLILDVAKGLLPVLLARYFTDSTTLHLVTGFAAIVGHNWPLFLKFRGGKGIATSIGVFIGLAPLVLLIGCIVGGLVIAVTRYVSLGSIIGALSAPIAMIILDMPPVYIFFGIIICIMVIWRHRENIVRLLNGTENKLGTKVKIENEGK